MKKASNRLEGSRGFGYSHRKGLVLLFCLVSIMSACRSIPPTVIGAETRENLEALEDQAETVAKEAADIDLGLETVGDDLTALEPRIPEDIKQEFQAIQDKVTVLSGLAGKVTAGAEGVVGKAVEARGAFEGDMAETAKLADEKARAEAGKLKAEKRSLFLGGIVIFLGGCLFLLFRTKKNKLF